MLYYEAISLLMYITNQATSCNIPEYFTLVNKIHLASRKFYYNYAKLKEKTDRWFSSAKQHFPELWTDFLNLKEHLKLQGHRERYVITMYKSKK